jgi:hypothetical protein
MKADRHNYFLSSFAFAAITLAVPAAFPASGPGDVVGKVVAGYQGWFSCKGDGSPLNNWGHMNLEMWPDVRDYAATYAGCPFYQAEKAVSPFDGNLGNGQPAKMFSSNSPQVMNTHCLWMQQNGIDCAALQRFGSYCKPGTPLKAFHDSNAVHLMKAAERTGRKFFIMYDCSATTPVDSDWTTTVTGSLHLTTSPAYARQNGKPVVCMWGVGKSDRGAIADWVAKINRFKSLGCYVIGGALQGWRGGADMSCYNACDMIMPWMVGRNAAVPQPYFESWYRDDLAYCSTYNIDYQADIYPGTGFYNTDSTKPKNMIPRRHGDFMWAQFAAARNTGVQSVYISMFDEAQEATSIFKVAENAARIPAGSYFLTLDADGVACSADFYLRLTNDGGKMVKGLAPYVTAHPTPHLVSTAVDGSEKKGSVPLTAPGLSVKRSGSTVIIRWSLPSIPFPENGSIDLAIFDVSGKCIRRFEAKALNAGGFRFVGDEKERLGLSAPNGCYFARITCGGITATSPFLLTR